EFSVRGDEAELEISDQGGKPLNGEVAPGVGRTLMTAFARQLRGRAQFEPNAEGGVTVRLSFPTPEATAVGT
ncbi:MAG TPA: sensor histidine kinase, partial [Caulobacteraceae bacterium]